MPWSQLQDDPIKKRNSDLENVCDELLENDEGLDDLEAYHDEKTSSVETKTLDVDERYKNDRKAGTAPPSDDDICLDGQEFDQTLGQGSKD